MNFSLLYGEGWCIALTDWDWEGARGIAFRTLARVGRWRIVWSRYA